MDRIDYVAAELTKALRNIFKRKHNNGILGDIWASEDGDHYPGMLQLSTLTASIVKYELEAMQPDERLWDLNAGLKPRDRIPNFAP